MFVVRYDLSDMPPNCQTFIRQRTLFMPTDASEKDPEASRWLRYLIHLRFASSKSGRIYLHTDVRIIVFRKSDLDAATIHGDRPYELRSFTQCPVNPKFSPCEWFDAMVDRIRDAHSFVPTDKTYANTRAGHL